MCVDNESEREREMERGAPCVLRKREIVGEHGALCVLGEKERECGSLFVEETREIDRQREKVEVVFHVC